MDDRSAGVVLAQMYEDLVVARRVAPASDDREPFGLLPRRG